MLRSFEVNVRSVESLLRRGIELGVFRVRSPVLLAHEIVVIAQDWGQQKWFLGGLFTREEYTRLWTENILDLILVDRENRDRVKVTSAK